MKADCLLIHKDDNVAVALKPLAKGETVAVGGETIVLKSDIPAGHKIARRQIGKGEKVIKYGHPIGHATVKIPAGDWVHSHNLKTSLSGTLDYTYRPERPRSPEPEADRVLPAGEASLNGYIRENGDVGIRNEIWVINTVGCINKTAEAIAKIADARFDKAPDPRGSTGLSFPHPFGCSQLGTISSIPRRSWPALFTTRMPAACWSSALAVKIIISMSSKDPQALRRKAGQIPCRAGSGGRNGRSPTLVGRTGRLCRHLQREPVPAAKLKVGLKCGGSDGFSGISANPLVGAFTDLLLAHGGQRS